MTPPAAVEGVEVKFSTAPPAGLPSVSVEMFKPGEVRAVPTKIRVSRSVKFKKDKFTPAEEAMASEPDELIEVHQFATTPAAVHFFVDLKKCKDFNSAGFTVGITMPCYVEEVPQAFQVAYDELMERCKIELPKIIKAAYDLRDARIADREKA